MEMTKVNNKTTGSRIRAKRKELGYSQEQFADLMNTTKGTICKYENDLIDIKKSALMELAAGLDVSVGYLVDGEKMITDEEQRLLDIFRRIEGSGLREILIKQAEVLAEAYI